MSDELPTTRAAWKQSARRKGIGHTQALTAATDWPSGSKFQFEHFLRLRVLYTALRHPRTLGGSDGFPKEGVVRVKKLLDADAHASFLKGFMQNTEGIKSDWNVDSARQSGKFAIPLEHLHLIAKRGVDVMKASEDIIDRKIDCSPRKTRSMTQSSAPHPARPFETPTKMGPQLPLEPPSMSDGSDDLGMSYLSMASPEERFSPPNSDLRRAQDSHERSNFSRGDEQTVNAMLVDLMVVLSLLLGSTGRIHYDRARYTIPKDAENDLYSACVDGLIMHLTEDKLNGFMEVKGNLRGVNVSVRRQIAAQMAAFVFEQDVVIAEKETGKTAETAPKGKGKQPQAEESKGKDKEGGGRKK